MSSKKKGGGNPYVQKGKNKGFLDSRLPTKGNVKNTAIETGKDVLVGVIGGGLVAAVIGKPSLLVGIGLTGAGHFMDNSLLKMLGIGVMASNGLTGQSGYNKDAIMSRLQSYKGNITEKLYIDKIINRNAASSEATTNGMGEVQFFNYPNDVSTYRELNGELNELENGIVQTALQQMEGMNDVEGLDDIGDTYDYQVGDASELNL